MQFVPFRTGPEVLTGVMRGDVQLFVDAPPLIAPQAKVGALKVLAVTGRVREPDLPDVPTIAEAGFPGAEAEAWLGLIAPAKAPGEAVTDLNRKIAAIMVAPDVQQPFAKLSFRSLTGSSDTLRQLIDEGPAVGPGYQGSRHQARLGGSNDDGKAARTQSIFKRKLDAEAAADS